MRSPKMFFRKQTKSWYVQLGTKQINLGKDKAEAEKRFYQVMGQYKRQVSIGDDTVCMVLEAYKGWLQAERAESTARMRSMALTSFQNHVGPKLRVWQIKPLHVQAWCTELFGKRSATYRNYVIVTVCRAITWAVEMGYMTDNPLAKMKKPSATVRQEFIPAELWPKLLSMAKDESFRDWLRFMLLSGARTQEMFKIEARYFDKAGSKIVFPMQESKGKKRSRVIYLTDEAVEIATKWAVKFPTGPMFRNTRDIPWDKNSINCRFKRLKMKMDLPKLSATVLRHSFAANRLNAGQDSLLVSKLLGHVDGRMLATRYGHIDQNPDLMLRAANAVSAKLTPS